MSDRTTLTVKELQEILSKYNSDTEVHCTYDQNVCITGIYGR